MVAQSHSSLINGSMKHSGKAVCACMYVVYVNTYGRSFEEQGELIFDGIWGDSYTVDGTYVSVLIHPVGFVQSFCCSVIDMSRRSKELMELTSNGVSALPLPARGLMVI